MSAEITILFYIVLLVVCTLTLNFSTSLLQNLQPTSDKKLQHHFRNINCHLSQVQKTEGIPSGTPFFRTLCT